jgi:hypothetical protein
MKLLVENMAIYHRFFRENVTIVCIKGGVFIPSKYAKALSPA